MEYIYEKKNTLTDEICDEIIYLFEQEKINKHIGMTLSGYKPQSKKTIDYLINCEDDDKWKNIDNTLFNVLYENINKYFKKFTKYCFHSYLMRDSGFLIQKYLKNDGFFNYHDDFKHTENGEYRIITYLWYLNDVFEGGETEFFKKYKIIPEKGKLVLFPTFWTYPHCGLIPKSNDKYIITGWISINPDLNIFEIIK
jgi:hypothetical protein